MATGEMGEVGSRVGLKLAEELFFKRAPTGSDAGRQRAVTRTAVRHVLGHVFLAQNADESI